MKYNQLIYGVITIFFSHSLTAELPPLTTATDKSFEHINNMLLFETFIPLYTLDQDGNVLSESPSFFISATDVLPTRVCSTASPVYQLILPTQEGSQGQILGLADNSGTLTWLTTLTNSTQLNLLYTATSCNSPEACIA